MVRWAQDDPEIPSLQILTQLKRPGKPLARILCNHGAQLKSFCSTYIKILWDPPSIQSNEHFQCAWTCQWINWDVCQFTLGSNNWRCGSPKHGSEYDLNCMCQLSKNKDRRTLAWTMMMAIDKPDWTQAKTFSGCTAACQPPTRSSGIKPPSHFFSDF